MNFLSIVSELIYLRNLKIRPAIIEDLGGVKTIYLYADAGEDKASKKFVETIKRGSTDSICSDTIFVLQLENDVIGYINFSISFLKEKLYADIDSIVIAKEYQKKGYGQLLMLHTLLHCWNNRVEKISLITEFEAITFYTKLGFRPPDLTHKTWQDIVKDLYDADDYLQLNGGNFIFNFNEQIAQNYLFSALNTNIILFLKMQDEQILYDKALFLLDLKIIKHNINYLSDVLETNLTQFIHQPENKRYDYILNLNETLQKLFAECQRRLLRSANYLGPGYRLLERIELKKSAKHYEEKVINASKLTHLAITEPDCSPVDRITFLMSS